MTSSSPVKVLVCGDVEGLFLPLIKRVSVANSKAGPFDLLLCTGQFFSSSPEQNDALLNGQINLPIPTYILGPCSPATVPFYPESSAELAPNLTYLGRKGQLNTASGLSIAFLSGSQSDDVQQHLFNSDTVDELLVPATAAIGYRGVDVLLTAQWPMQVHKYANSKPKDTVEGSDMISKVATILKPRYHFAGLAGVHYERSPYRNHRVLQESAEHCTRFIGLAKVGNASKSKFLYAFNLVPLRSLTRDQLTEQPPDACEFPYAEVLRDLKLREQRREKQSDGKQYFFDMNAKMEDQGDQTGRKRRADEDPSHQSAPKRPMGPCWFCLSSPQVEKHLVVSIADSCYLAIAKGALTDDHVLILPIGHIQSYVAAADDVRSDIGRYQSALRDCFKTQAKDVVFFERNYRTQHMQIQAVPVPKECSAKLKDLFLSEAEMKGIELSEVGEEQKLTDLVNEGCPYFYVELPDSSKLFTRQMRQFPIQFGREVLSSPAVLKVPDRADWKNCVLEKDGESDQTNRFRKIFSDFDIADVV